VVHISYNSIRISFLDLSKHADVVELKALVETISNESCEELSAMYALDYCVAAYARKLSSPYDTMAPAEFLRPTTHGVEALRLVGSFGSGEYLRI